MIQASEIPQLTMSAEEATAFDLHLQEIEGMEASALMKNAGRALALFARTHAEKVGARTVLAVAGPGNNGGDAWVAARQLQAGGGFVVTGWAPLGMPHSPEGPAGEAARQALKAGVGIHEGPTPPLAWDLALDGLFGLGLSRPLEGAAADAVAALNASPAPTLSADLPSGLDGDTGRVLGCAVQARATLSFIGSRPGFLLGEGPAHVGEVWVADLGVSESLTLAWLQARRRGGIAPRD